MQTPVEHVYDATKIKAWDNCPRRFWFEYVEHIRPAEPNIHLLFGECWHIAMEHLLRNGYAQPQVDEAFALFMKRWREKVHELNDENWAPKTPANALRALTQYAQHYKIADASMEVLYTEVSGSVPVSDIDMNKRLYFKIDAICRSPEFGLFVFEHKTCSYFDRNYAAQFDMDVQTDCYTHALHWHFPDEPIFGVIVNAMSIKNPPRLKKDGTPYAGSTDNEAQRIYVPKTLQHISAWLYNISDTIDEIERNFALLPQCSDSDEVMRAFPKRSTHCVNKYGICPFHGICKLWNNPLRENLDQPGFKREVWDPRDKEKTAKEVWHLT